MFKIKLYIFFFTISIFITNINKADISIVSRVNDDIITNFEVEKEIKYLKILNSSINSLNNSQLFELAKNSLIREKIKKSEVSKLFDLNKKNNTVDEFLKNFYSKIGINNENELILLLKDNRTYSINELKDKLNIELLWNNLILQKYSNQIVIDNEKIKKKIINFEGELEKEYLLSEILFEKKRDTNLQEQIDKIELSIKEIGFNNTANIFSISDSSKFGGKLGWIKQKSLAKNILLEVDKIEVGDHTKVINLGNNFLILKKENSRINEIKINKDEEFQKLRDIEINKQLNQFSKIYFNKTKINYFISNE